MEVGEAGITGRLRAMPNGLDEDTQPFDVPGHYLTLQFDCDDWSQYDSVVVGISSDPSYDIEIVNGPVHMATFNVTGVADEKITITATSGEEIIIEDIDISPYMTLDPFNTAEDPQFTRLESDEMSVFDECGDYTWYFNQGRAAQSQYYGTWQTWADTSKLTITLADDVTADDADVVVTGATATADDSTPGQLDITFSAYDSASSDIVVQFVTTDGTTTKNYTLTYTPVGE